MPALGKIKKYCSSEKIYIGDREQTQQLFYVCGGRGYTMFCVIMNAS